jgi:glycosyltransferase involved in cell wall biosynthesis
MGLAVTQSNVDVDGVLLSFVIPALNEAENITALIESIDAFCPVNARREIIVVDNGSSDDTCAIARDMGAMVLGRPGVTIAALRNEGAQMANGRVVIFLDADMRLCESWQSSLSGTIEKLLLAPRTVCGSPALYPDDSSWVAKVWGDFSRKTYYTHIGSGHMIVEREAFLKIGGFDSSLRTGEDFEFCRRAIANGFRLQPDLGLSVVHTRLPGSIRDFIRRELWHGSGDSASFVRLLNSRVALLSLFFAVLHLAAIGWIIATPPNRWMIVVGIFTALIAALSLAGAVRRAGIDSPPRMAARALLVYLYLWARFWAVLRGIARDVKMPAETVKGRGW